MNHAQAAKVAVLGAERTVDDVDLLNQFRTERLQGTEITLPVALRSMILLHVVDENLEAAVDAAMIQVEAEPADFERFAAAFVLPHIDAGVQLLKHLVVAREQSSIEHLAVAQIDRGLYNSRFDHDALRLGRQLFELQAGAGCLPLGQRNILSN